MLTSFFWQLKFQMNICLWNNKFICFTIHLIVFFFHSAAKDIIAVRYENVDWFRIFNMKKKEFLPKIKPYQNKRKDWDRACVDAMAISRDGQWVVVSSYKFNNLEFYNTQDGSHMKSIQGKYVQSRQGARDNRLLVFTVSIFCLRLSFQVIHFSDVKIHIE